VLHNAIQEFLKLFTLDVLQKVILVVVIGAAGLLVLRFLSALLNRMTRKYLSQQYSMLLRKAVQYTGAVIVLFVILSVLGVKITALLGAAGIVGIAVGFAAQTSMSNLISGLFLISEKPFQIGDVIKVENNTGVILSIDLLSVKIQTFDNQYIRIPNSVLLNTELTNVTRFPIRRMDIKLRVSYRTDVSRLRELLLAIANSNPHCLDEPEPLIVFSDFGESGLEFLFGVWFYKQAYLELKNSIMQQIQEGLAAAGIEFALPARSLYAGSQPLPFAPAGRAIAAARGSPEEVSAPADPAALGGSAAPRRRLSAARAAAARPAGRRRRNTHSAGKNAEN
jgi:small-conductance mechanosensitive channel